MTTADAEAALPSFTCHCCGAVSYNRNDIAQRFCGRCDDWTGDPGLGARHMARHCPHRQEGRSMSDPDGIPEAAVMAPHVYVSTACVHGECGACRNTCKYCDAPCSHACHPASARGLPEPWVDQARGIAALLLGALGQDGAPEELRRRIASDPGLFWLRGEAKPPGEWRDPKITEDHARD
jgi:hypothetical protein